MKPDLKLVKPEPPPLHDAEGPAQSEMPFAIVEGEPVTQLPRDLYIPPYALEVFLEAFEGPLDLLLYLIKRQNLDILDVPIAEITHQYTQYIELMKDMQLELAGEYLLMAAMLAEIKSRMLLPRPDSDEDDEDDPRAELVRRLQEYERYKKVALEISELPRLERDVFLVEAEVIAEEKERILPDITLREMLVSLREVMSRAEHFAHHHIQREQLSVRERMSEMLNRLQTSEFVDFVSMFTLEEGRMGVAVSFLAILELIKEGLIDIVQTETFGPIHIRAAEKVMHGDIARDEEAGNEV